MFWNNRISRNDSYIETDVCHKYNQYLQLVYIIVIIFVNTIIIIVVLLILLASLFLYSCMCVCVCVCVCTDKKVEGWSVLVMTGVLIS